MRYDVPQTGTSANRRGGYRGKTDLVFAAPMGRDCDVCLRACEHPEFDAWRWANIGWILAR